MISNLEKTPSHPHLTEVPYPNDLRVDRDAITFVDEQGYTYLSPNKLHDWQASQALYTAGLTMGEVVEVPDHGQLLRYSPDADLMPLSSLLNSSIEDEQMSHDIASALYLVGVFFVRAGRKCNFSPAMVKYDMFAIDKGNVRAEPLPPYYPADHVVPTEVLMQQLQDSILANSKSDVQRERIVRAFARATGQLEDF